MPDNGWILGQKVRKHKKLGVLLLVAVVVLLIYASLVIAFLTYDRTDPRARLNAFYGVEEVIVDRPIHDVFRFIQNGIPSVYTRLSPMHDEFEIVNAEMLILGAEVDCVEVDVYDYYDFESLGSDRTGLRQTVVFDFGSPFVKEIVDIVAIFAGTRDDWEQQLREQKRNLAAFEKEAS